MTSDPISNPTINLSHPPYRPSWFDRLLAWIDDLPGPVWAYYLAALLMVTIVINTVFWIDGMLPVGSFDTFNSTFALFVVYWPLLYSYLTQVGSRSLHAYRPLLDLSDGEIARIEYKLTILPRWIGWLTVPMGFGLASLSVLTDPAPFGDLVPKTAVPYIGDILLEGFMIATFFCLLIRSIRQLRMVSELHSQATNINLLELKPAHAFSDLTARTGIGVILIVIVSYPADPHAFGTGLSIVLTTVTTLLAIGIFVLPVIGLQSRLDDEKERALSQTHAQLQIVRNRLHNEVKSGQFEDMGAIKDAIEALIDERDLLKSVSTWPWNPKTIRGFVSALLLPLFLGLATRLLEKIM
jgi:hypothetical protein